MVSSKQQQSESRAFSRRKALMVAGAGALGLATIASSTLGNPAPASASTTDVFYDKGGAVFNVKAYGAIGNGTTDDTAAIVATVSAAAAAGGGIVFFSEGQYLISSVIQVTTYGITLMGAGASASVILGSSGYLSGDLIRFTTLNSNKSAGGVRALGISSSGARTGGSGIALVAVSNIVIEDVDMYNQYIGIQITGAGVLQHINRGYYQNFTTGGTGIWVNSFASNDTYINEIIMDNGDGQTPAAGLRITQSQAVWARACDFLHANNCLLIDTPSGGTISWCFFSECAFDNGISRSMFINPASGGTVWGLTFVNCWSSSAHTYDGCYIGGPVDGVEFIGHRFIGNQGNGLEVVGPAKNVHVDSCVSSGNAAGYGYDFSGSASNFAVRNSHSGPYAGRTTVQTYGIGVQSGSNNYVIVGNTLQGNTVGLSDSGGPTKVVANNLT